MKIYPLKIENIGEDEYNLMSRGHHDFKKFMDALREWEWPMGKPEHLYFKATPTRMDGYRCMYYPVSKSTKGCFPVTVCREAYGDEQWAYDCEAGDNG